MGTSQLGLSLAWFIITKPKSGPFNVTGQFLRPGLFEGLALA